MNFTNNPYEKMMKEKPRPPRRGGVRKPPKGSPCRDCSYWNGTACVGVCYRELLISRKKGRETSGQVGPMSHEE